MTRRLPALVLALVLGVSGLSAVMPFAQADVCGTGLEAVMVDGSPLCTHGDDEPPPGVDTTELPSTDELLEARFGTDSPAEAADEYEDAVVAAAGSVACIDDGYSGPRVQLVYARAADVTSRYSNVLPLLRQYASDADDLLNASAGRVGDGRRIRYVTNGNCDPDVLNVTLSNTGDDTFGNSVAELRAMGLTSSDRKYLIFGDAAVGICGLGEVYLNDRPDELNPNNIGRAMYARVDASCWQHAAAHELLHTLGAVQNSAPHSSGAGHCTDEIDVMCYKDRSTTVIQQVCTTASQVDCNNDDYYHPNPKAASYLATKWNVARSRYLQSTEAPPRPSTTTVTVPASGSAGVAWPVSAVSSDANATVVWSSTRTECEFANATAASTTFACPATTQGSGDVIATVTEDGMATPYAKTVAFVPPVSPQPLSLSLSKSASTITAGQTVSLTGRVDAFATSAPVWGLDVKIEAMPKTSTTWSTVATGVTSRYGIIRADFTPTRNVSYRLRAIGNATWASALSASTAVSVQTKVKTRINSMTVAGYDSTAVDTATRTRIAGTVSPDKDGDKILLRRYRDGRWRTIRTKRLSSESTYRFRFTPRRSGTVRLRVVKPSDRSNLQSRRTIRLNVG